MLKRRDLLIATALGPTLGLLPASPAPAAGQVIAQGRAGADPGVLVWLDTDQGTRLDHDAARTIHDQFAGTVWEIRDDQHLGISKGGKQVLAAQWISNPEKTLFVLHGRTARMFGDGTISVNPEDTTRGFAVLYVTQISADGRTSRSLRIEVDLSFGEQQSPAGDGGFGNF